MIGELDQDTSDSDEFASQALAESAHSKPDPVMIVAAITGLTIAFIMIRDYVDFRFFPGGEDYVFGAVIAVPYCLMRFTLSGKRRNPNDSESDWYLYYVCAACACVAYLLLT